VRDPVGDPQLDADDLHSMPPLGKVTRRALAVGAIAAPQQLLQELKQTRRLIEIVINAYVIELRSRKGAYWEEHHD
jgi:hypothetical protein